MSERTYKVGSLFDGSGGFPLAGSLCGVEPVWAAEVEPYPIAVTRSRFPHMKHLGDVTKVNGADIEPVDIITFGSPCQDLSVAGKRAGLKHEANGDDETTRSGLFMEAIRIIKEMRGATNGIYPRFAVWENVFGAFSSNRGEDFRIVLEELIKIVEPTAVMPAVPKNGWPYADSYCGDGWSLAYRTFDAQYWGVPQRRRRIYLVADFGGECAAEILFEREGLYGYSAEGFRSWQRAAGSFTPCTGATGFDGDNGSLTDDTSATLGVNCGMSTGRNGIVLNDQGGDRMDITEEVTSTLRAEAHHPPCVMESAGFCTEHSAKSRTIGYEEECSPTLRAGVVPAAVALENHPNDSRVNISDDGKVKTLTSGCEGGGKGPLIQTDRSATLSCNNDQILFKQVESLDCRNIAVNPELFGTLQAKNNGGFSLNYINPVVYGICSKESNSMKADNPNSGFYEAKTTRTIDANGGNSSAAEEMANTLMASGYKYHPLINDKSYGFYPQMKTEGMAVTEEKSTTLVNGTNPDYQNGVVEQDYIVRHLTPTECARLQGFPDKWGHPDHNEDFTNEEYSFWLNVRNTYAEINGKAVRQYTRQKMLAWYNKLHTDSAEYKMWGNGIALPCALYVMQGIQYVLNGGDAQKKHTKW